MQEKKRLLAETAIEGGMKKDVLKLGFKEIMDLFRRDQPHEAPVDGTGSAGPSREASDLGDMTARSNVLKAKAKKTEDSVYGRRW